MSASFYSPLRDATWLTERRVRGYGWLLLIITAGVALVWVFVSSGGRDPEGMPLGSDFTAFWTASSLSLAGRPFDSYNEMALRAAQEMLFGRGAPFFPFFYPPPFLLICAPLALASYSVALLAWLGVTGTAYLQVIKRVLPPDAGLMPALAFPAVFVTVAHGQNAFLITALFGAGLLWLDRWPVLAGLCLGALVIKPHLAALIPFALLVTRRWWTLTSFAGSAAFLSAVSLVAFGPDTWRAFLENAHLARVTLEDGLIGFAKMQSVFAAVRLIGGSVPFGYGVQVAVALAAMAGLLALHRRCPKSSALGPALVVATLLTSPFLFDYDLTLLAIPLAWLLAQGAAGGFLPWEKTVLGCAFLLPAVSRPMALHLGLPVAPLVLGAFVLILVRRGLSERPDTVSSVQAA